LFIKQSTSSCVILLVYVDDIILTGNNEKDIQAVKVFLGSQFMIKDLGELKFFLGIEIVETSVGLCLSQRKYCLDLLHEYGLLSSKPVNTPLDMNAVITSKGINSDDHLIENVTEFQKIVGKLIYLTNTRPDISYTVHVISRFMQAPRMSHFKLALRVLRYLKGVPGLGILIPKGNSLVLSAWSDADWGKCLDTRRSVTGYAIFLGKSLISWKSKKQTTVSKSSTEAEYRALSTTTCELLLILKIMREIGIKNVLPISLYCDNRSAVLITANPVMHEKTKHIDIDAHLVRDKVTEGVVKVFQVESENQVADILTKALGFKQHELLCNKLGLYNLFQV